MSEDTLKQKPHNHQRCFEQAIKTAEKICNESGKRFTSQRKAILELICSSHKAIGAYELLEQFQKQDPKAKPITIYRNLEFLLENGLIHKIESLNAFIGCLDAGKHHHTAILICKVCHNAYEFIAEQAIQNLQEISMEHQFQTESLIIELHGYCASCQPA